jgi:hypothetical protein
MVYNTLLLYAVNNTLLARQSEGFVEKGIPSVVNLTKPTFPSEQPMARVRPSWDLQRTKGDLIMHASN